jgi:hypothetical protein
MNKKALIVIVIGVFVFGGAVLFAVNKGGSNERVVSDQISTVTPTTTSSISPTPSEDALPVLQYGKVTLHSGETAIFKDNSVTLLSVTEDSRCAEGVTCIWAGTLKATILSVSGMGTSSRVIELGKFITTEGETITLLSAEPYPKAGTTISPNEYRLTFEVTKRTAEAKPAPVPPKVTPTPPPVSNTKPAACYKGGCSGEICSDRQDMISTCIFREEYACYQNATCERQASGDCGWTATAELQACLSGARSMTDQAE